MEDATSQRRTSATVRESLMRLGASRGVDGRRVVAAFVEALEDPAEFRTICELPNRYTAGREAVRRYRRLIRLRREAP
jgi:hypothetical protein